MGSKSATSTVGEWNFRNDRVITVRLKASLSRKFPKVAVVISRYRTVYVVVEDIQVPGRHVVGVDALDGQVMDRGRLGPGLNRGDLHPGAGRGLQPHARGQVDRVHPQARVRNPERVTIGSHDHIARGHRSWNTRGFLIRTGLVPCGGIAFGGRVDGDLHQGLTARAHDRCQDRPSRLLPCLGIGRQNLLADIDVLDGFGGPIGHHHTRPRSEAVPDRTAHVLHLLVGPVQALDPVDQLTAQGGDPSTRLGCLAPPKPVLRGELGGQPAHEHQRDIRSATRLRSRSTATVFRCPFLDLRSDS